jgi:putative acetyltransferase
VEVVIKQAQAVDIESLWKIYLKATGESATRKDDYWKVLIQAGGMIVAELNNQTVGFGAIDVQAKEQIKYVYIAPQYQKLGIGAKILMMLEKIGQQAGFDHLMLHANPQAVDFYKRAGYTAIENEIDHDHEGVQMMKKLS